MNWLVIYMYWQNATDGENMQIRGRLTQRLNDK